METACSDCKYSQYVGVLCCCRYCCVCYTYIQPEFFGIHTENTAHVSCTLRLICIPDRYQVLGVRHCSYSQYLNCCLFSGLSATLRVQYASCSRSNLGVYCKLLSAAMPYVPLLLLCCCWCCGWVCTAAAAATDRSSSDACYYSCCCCGCCHFACCAAAAIAFMCGRDPLFCTSVVGSRYSSP